MNRPEHVSPDQIRDRFSRAMSEMYRKEVPMYDTLLELVADINARRLSEEPALRKAFESGGELDRLGVERHGAIRLGTAAELSQACRVFAVMGMEPVGYYDLSVAGVPVHSTAFRPVTDEGLAANPFRVFTSLLRLELIADPALREQAARILARRRIFSERALELTALSEREGGLEPSQAAEFVAEVRQTFRWRGQSSVSADTYRQLHASHRLVADVVCFDGPHINHLTPRTLDIDAVQDEMASQGLEAKDVIEGPPRRRHAILLRQTSFRALVETVRFADSDAGQHTARFGEVEQRGMALTREGRALYDRLLARARAAQGSAPGHAERLAQAFADFPDDLDVIRRRQLAYFRYRWAGVVPRGLASSDLETLVASGAVIAEPVLYEDFLPVSAAGIFRSNLGDAEQASYASRAARADFEQALGRAVHDEFELYEAVQQRSIEAVVAASREVVAA